MKKITSLKKQKPTLLLLIDKEGDIGSAILLQMQKENIMFSAVFAAKEFLSPDENLRPAIDQEVLFCPFQDTLPQFPNGDYSHILIVYNGEKEVLDALSGFAKKAEEFKGLLFFVIPIHLYTKDLQKDMFSIEQSIHVVIVGDIFSELVLHKKNKIGQFFHNAKKDENIIVSGMGLEFTYPVYMYDAVSVIVKTVFLTKEKKSLLFIFPKYPPTVLGLARIFQKIDPILRIDFIGEEDKNTNELSTEGIYALNDTYQLEEKIKQVYLYKHEIKYKEEDLQPAMNNKARKNTRLYLFCFVFFLFIFFLLPFLSTLFFMTLGAYDLSKAKNVVSQGDIQKAQEYAKKASTFLHFADKTFAVFNKIPFLQKEKVSLWLETNLAQEKRIVLLFLESSNLNNAWKEKNGVALSANTRSVIALLQTIGIQKGNMPIPSFSTTIASTIVNSLHDILGFEKPRTYLVLLQNNMELRPGGGFIGSYAIAKVDRGDVTFSIHDVYDADGQLKGHVEPPFAIRRHLKSIHWYLRDSNFAASFPTNASTSAFFLKQETGVVVDGVIAVDASFVKMIVSALGSINVLDYNETVTKDNFYTLLQNHAEKDFFPGSTQKKDFLRSLFNAIQIRLAQKNISYQQLYAALLQGITEKHVLVSLGEQSLQNVFTINNMSSTLFDNRSVKESLLDFVGISEANLGVNKANVGISRRLAYDVDIDKNASVSAKLSVVYKNEKHNNIYAADYKNYIRVIVPKNSVLKSISINGEEQKLIPAITDPKTYEAKNFTEPKGLEVNREEENNKTMFGFLVNVPLGSETKIVVTYMLTWYLSALPNSFTYDLLLYKQPGTEAYPVSFSLQYPKEYVVIKTKKEFIKKENVLRKEIIFISDTGINVLFGAK